MIKRECLTTYTCDRCDFTKQVVETPCPPDGWMSVTPTIIESSYPAGDKIDLCEECAFTFVRWKDHYRNEDAV